MDALLLQDWITLRGASSVTVLTQQGTDWLDVTAYQDLVTWLEVKEFSGTSVNLAYQTSPTKDDALFFAMATVAAATGVTTTVMLKDAMPAGMPPCGRWFRWQITAGAAAWDLTFRIWVAANRIGNRVAISEAVSLGYLEDLGYRYAYGQWPPTAGQAASTPVTTWGQTYSQQSGSGSQTGGLYTVTDQNSDLLGQTGPNQGNPSPPPGWGKGGSGQGTNPFANSGLPVVPGGSGNLVNKRG